MASFNETTVVGVRNYGIAAAASNIGLYIWTPNPAVNPLRRVGYGYFFLVDNTPGIREFLVERFPVYLPGVIVNPRVAPTGANIRYRLIIEWDSGGIPIQIFY